MSDMMQRPPAPQGGGVRDKMSMFNPTDVAAKASRGDISQGMTVGQFLQRNFGVMPTDPVQKLFQSIKGQAQNATAMGKMGGPNVPPQPQARPQMPQQRPQMPPQRPQAPPQQPGGLDALIGRMGGA